MERKANKEIRDKIKRAGLRQWEVAARAGIAESTFVKWIRFHLEGDKLERVERAIDELTERSGNDE